MMGKINPWTLLLLTVILVLGFFLRAQEALSGNFLFLLDQGRDMQAVKQIVFDHHLTLIGPYTSLQGIFQGPLWYYLLGIPTLILNGDPKGTIWLMLAISMSVLVLCFFAMQKLFGIKAALLTTFILSISPEAIAAATYAWNPHPMWLLVTIYIFSLYKLIQNKKKYHVLVWGTISLMFHFQAALGFFIFVATITYLLLFGRKLLKNKYLLYGAILFIVFFLPQVIFELRHDFLMTKSFLNLFTGADQRLFTKGEQQPFVSILDGHMYAFVVNFNSVFQKLDFFPNFPLFILGLSFVLFAIGKSKKILQKEESQFITMCVQIVGIIFILTCLYPFPLRYWFLTGFEMFYILPIGLLLSVYLRYKIWIAVILLFIIMNFAIVIPKLQHLYKNPDYGGISKLQGKLDAIDFVYKDAKGDKSFGLLVFNPAVNNDAYDYLVWWKSKEKYDYIPHQEKKGTFYLLIEPDSGKPWSYKGWLETVIKTGNVVFEKNLPSGHIVQKRVLTY